MKIDKFILSLLFFIPLFTLFNFKFLGFRTGDLLSAILVVSLIIICFSKEDALGAITLLVITMSGSIFPFAEENLLYAIQYAFGILSLLIFFQLLGSKSSSVLGNVQLSRRCVIKFIILIFVLHGLYVISTTQNFYLFSASQTGRISFPWNIEFSDWRGDSHAYGAFIGGLLLILVSEKSLNIPLRICLGGSGLFFLVLIGSRGPIMALFLVCLAVLMLKYKKFIPWTVVFGTCTFLFGYLFEVRALDLHGLWRENFLSNQLEMTRFSSMLIVNNILFKDWVSILFGYSTLHPPIHYFDNSLSSLLFYLGLPGCVLIVFLGLKNFNLNFIYLDNYGVLLLYMGIILGSSEFYLVPRVFIALMALYYLLTIVNEEVVPDERL